MTNVEGMEVLNKLLFKGSPGQCLWILLHIHKCTEMLCVTSVNNRNYKNELYYTVFGIVWFILALSSPLLGAFLPTYIFQQHPECNMTFYEEPWFMWRTLPDNRSELKSWLRVGKCGKTDIRSELVQRHRHTHWHSKYCVSSCLPTICPGPGCENSSSTEAQTALSLPTSTSSSGGLPKQPKEQSAPRVSFWMDMPENTPWETSRPGFVNNCHHESTFVAPHLTCHQRLLTGAELFNWSSPGGELDQTSWTQMNGDNSDKVPRNDSSTFSQGNLTCYQHTGR